MLIELTGDFETAGEMVATIERHRQQRAQEEAEELRVAEEAVANDPEVQAWKRLADAEHRTMRLAKRLPPTPIRTA